MEFEKYDPERHSEMVKPRFADLSQQPASLSKYMEVIEEALEDIEDIFGISTSFKIVVASTDLSKVDAEPEGGGMYSFIQGMGLSEQVHNVEEPTVFLRMTDQVDDWKSFLKSLVVHEEAHIEFQEEREVGYTILKHLMYEGHAMLSDRKVSEEKSYDWRQDWQLPDIDPKEFLAELDKKRSWDEKQSDQVSTLFDSEGEKWNEAEGYNLAFYITKEIIERNNLKVEDLLEINYNDWRKEVEKSVEKLYNQE